MKVLIFVLLTIIVEVHAQGLELIAPKSGDTIQIGDTVTIKFKADSATYEEISGTRIHFSADTGKSFTNLCSFETPEFCPIPKSSQFWGNVRIIMPDSVDGIDADGNVTNISAIGNSGVFKLNDYGKGDDISCISNGFVVVVPAPTSIKNPYIPKQQEKVGKSNEKESNNCGRGFLLAFLPPIGIRTFRTVLKGNKND